MSEDKLMVGKLVIEPSSSIDEIVRLNTEIIELKAEIERLKNPWRPIKSWHDIPETIGTYLWQLPPLLDGGDPHLVSAWFDEKYVWIHSPIGRKTAMECAAWMPLPEPYKESE